MSGFLTRFCRLIWVWIGMAGMPDKRVERDNFLTDVRSEWCSMWKDRFDDKTRAESVAINKYPLIMVDHGQIVSATRDAKTPTYREIVDYWTAKGKAYSPPPTLGGWRKFAREKLRKAREQEMTDRKNRKRAGGSQQPSKKGGRGWLHKIE